MEVFSGDGGIYVAGRWNYKGTKVVYCSDSIALSTMEWLAHNGLSVSGFSYCKYSIEIPDAKIQTFTASQMPQGWDAAPSTDVSREFAKNHLFETDLLAIAVPSVMIPEEFNLVINPNHDDYASALTSIKNIGNFTAPPR